jgi:hypothetical protein
MTTLNEDLTELVGVFSGEDGGVTFVLVRQFVELCEAEGRDLPFLRQMARMCRILRLRMEG